MDKVQKHSNSENCLVFVFQCARSLLKRVLSVSYCSTACGISIAVAEHRVQRKKKKKKLVGLNNDNIFLTYANHVACEYVCPLSDTTIGSLQSTNVEWGDIEAKD